jgi:hypothetical protein
MPCLWEPTKLSTPLCLWEPTTNCRPLRVCLGIGTTANMPVVMHIRSYTLEDSDTGTKASMSVPFYHLALGPCTGVLGCRPHQSAEVQQSAANGCSPTESGRRSLLMSCPGQASNSKCNCYRVMPRLGTPLGPTDKPCIMGTPSPSSRRP